MATKGVQAVARIGSAALIGAVLIALAAYSTFYTPAPEEAITRSDSGTLSATSTKLRERITELDRNNNGVSDWKEELAAHSQRRLAGLPEAEYGEASGTTTADTLTNNFARAFFEDYMRAEMNGTLEEQDMTEYLGTFAEDITTEVSMEPYTRDDIVVYEDESTEALRDYGNEIAEIITSYDAARNEIDIVEEALETDEPAVLQELGPIANKFASLREDFLSVDVPSAASSLHLRMVNATHAMHGHVRAFQDVFEDPLRSYVHIEQYQVTAREVEQTLRALGRKLAAENIRYSDSEPGSFLNVLIEAE